jgi:hypothetical protein
MLEKLDEVIDHLEARLKVERGESMVVLTSQMVVIAAHLRAGRQAYLMLKSLSGGAAALAGIDQDAASELSTGLDERLEGVENAHDANPSPD